MESYSFCLALWGHSLPSTRLCAVREPHVDIQAPAEQRHRQPETLTEVFEVTAWLGPINSNELIGLVLSHYVLECF